ncbi:MULTISPECIES: ATP-dependent DNA helicase RecG [unclassified Clostridioides]|uniref:ATP-dependent DNA helicase RecG n=1 Tax=unclassified Clostridioides TaxID=2635829 RepID=UPI001D0C1E53|nr:ATP-dependent DNA helicase RecG [Clostridioides sp. ES-S-0001-02]MCC0639267.1 ATP-dependent DNA helicase RecG [Clostridioides sp. ES-S-0049-03]MCC0653008.1 ATP-dependent DNA helicase RecG [Clostridioides sp. ES-S-0001-03]MCC0657008.1 ATP-dependent DNA helicase RecG [Clostridioides sp. ES-S-0123-01]MCC0672418.1 ATP-dependent DNA helicase RecG [Clostridioides sp. ES-S-0145-01]MCC0675657.1 ATP-dependent DNA helicase RecG [Clostridioides sp. ES-W-0018-02]MCC0680276.1 ATP-dependent DNA helicase
MDLYKDVQYVKGIGPKKACKLNKLGIFTLKDLLYYFPRQFEDRNNLKKIAQLENDEKATIKAVISNINTFSPKEGMTLTKIDVKDETGSAKLVFFNKTYIKNTFRPGDSILVFGKVKKRFNNLELTSCELEYLTNSPKNTCRFMPVYQLTYGVTNKEIMSIIKTVLEDKELIIQEYMPQRIIEKYRLCNIDFAVRNIHSPSNKESLKIALYRIVFEELLILQLGLFVFKSGRNKENGIKFTTSESLKNIISSLPFKLTKAQNRALDEIINDMNSDKIMNRLVQGDVGSGKTVVALLALANCVLNGYQGALMAPTEILAGQHYISLTETLKDFGINVGLLIGSLTKKQKDMVLEQIKNNEIDILIGTHALIEDKVEFNNIGLVITDEQHRFGVMQRSRLSLKGINPDILVMTATPIPRTLALILYGDLDISIIDELPPGRQPIETLAIEKSKRDRAYNNLVRREVESGRQVYIVCPLVEESESIEAKSAVELVEELRAEYFSDLRLGLLHGKMKSSEKDEVMSNFKNKEIDILVSTTVIEVGVNVPNATLMIIENAERFGLAQLHQLRGRVGRGSHKSYCVLIYDSKTDVCRQRMSIMEETNDGFRISEKDLEIRGPGEFFGTRQHGLPELKVANLFKHIKILKLAQQEARYILGEDNNLQLKENIPLKKEIIDKFKDTLEEISLN